MTTPTTTATTTPSLFPPLSTPGYDVSGRVFVVTGGTQGLGLGIARQLQQQGAAGLVVVSRNQAKGDAVSKELSKDNCTCRFVKADLGNAVQAQSVIPQAVELMKTIGPISGLVNAAAITARGNLLTTTPEGFDIQMAINVRAPLLLTQAIAKHMMERKIRGSVVNISSVASHGGAPFISGLQYLQGSLELPHDQQCCRTSSPWNPSQCNQYGLDRHGK